MLQDNKAAVVIGSIVLYRGQGPSLDALCQPVVDALCQPVVGALCQPVVDISKSCIGMGHLINLTAEY